MEEIWKDIKGFEGIYQVSNTGKIKSMGRVMNVKICQRHKNGLMTINERVLLGRPNKKGYLKVALYKVMKRSDFTIHHLVLNTFKGERPTLLHQCRHLDGNNKNNHIDNLEWGTCAENIADKVKHGTCRGNTHLFGDNASNRKLSSNDVVEIRKLLTDGNSQSKVARLFNMSSGAIHKIATNKTWSKVC